MLGRRSIGSGAPAKRLTQGIVVTIVVGLMVPQATSAQSRPPSSQPTGDGGAGASAPASARAAPSPREAAESLRWDDRWGRFSVSESIATASLAAGILAVELALPTPTRPHWQGPVLLDQDVRLGLRGSSDSGRQTIGTASDVLLTALLAWPLLDVGTAWVVHGAPEVAAQMLAMDAEAFALTFLVTEVTKRLVARERPFAQDGACDGPNPPSACSSSTRYESFISGHTAMAFTAAGLVCAHHENLPLYGGGAADSIACATALGAAAAVGVFRIGADRHYLSDVFLGAGLGLLSGYLLPSWLHYDIGDDDPETGAPSGGTLLPIATPGGAGFGYQHIWY